MAGRPAARGGNGTLYGLIAFAVVSVLALGAFIWQLTLNQQLTEQANRANQSLKQFGEPPAYYRDEATARNTPVFKVMQNHLEDFGVLVSGRKDALYPSAKLETDRALGELATAFPDAVNAGDTMVTALRKLNRSMRSQSDAITRLNTDIESLRRENQTLADGNKLVRDEFEAQVASMKAEIERLESEKQQTLAAKDEQLTQVQSSLDSATEAGNRARVEKQQTDRANEIAQARQQRAIDELRAQVEALRPGAFDANAILSKADGTVLRAVPGSDVVYVNLGKQDRVRPGMGFEIFSPRGERRADFRGKASVEVTAVMDTVAECRVTRTTPSAPIVEGDLIVNIAYERSRQTQFVIRGEFDLNYDGVADFDGLERVTGIIRQWGGQVVAELSESTDFVVLGLGPQRLAAGDDQTEVVEGLINSRAAEVARWEAIIQQARDRSIPVITQNQFLYLTGYAGGPIVGN